LEKWTYVPSYVICASSGSNLPADELKNGAKYTLRDIDQGVRFVLGAFDKQPVEKEVIIEGVEIEGNEETATVVGVGTARTPAKETG
jgi:hypothetical protein